MKLKFIFIFFHTLLVVSSAGKVKEDSVYRNSEQSLEKQKSLRYDLLNGESHSASEDLSKLQHMVSLLEGSIGQINEQLTQNSNRYEFSNVGTRLTQLENMTANGIPESTTLNASTIQCGGRLLGESGVISYKEDEMYNNGENCTWIIEVPEALKIGFKLEKTGLEYCCDHINVTSLDTTGLVQKAPIKLNWYHHFTVFVDGPKAMVRFTSDSRRTGLGFRLSYFKITDLNSTVEGSHCGGILLGESGVISYKEDEMYNNEEKCTWIIEVPEAQKIGFKLEKTGLQRCCDHIYVASLDTAYHVQERNVMLKYYHQTVFVDGPKVIVRFSSDESQNGLGFRLSYYNITDLNSTIEDKNECGGVIVGETGEISYKFEESYLNNDRCVWLVHSPNSTSITFRLREAEFFGCCDFLSVTTIDPETGTLRNDTRLLMEYDETVTIQESTAVVAFSSLGTGFPTHVFLTFSGSGVNTNPKYVYKLRHIAELNATIEYSASDRNDDGITKQQHIYVTAKSAKGNRQLSEKFTSGIDLKEGIFVRANDSSCVYDSLTFYEPIPPAVLQHHDRIPNHNWQKKAQIPSKNDILLCPEKFSKPTQKALLDFGEHSFLAIYKQISKDTFGSNAAVSFDYYYKPHKCVEIVQPLENEFGIITYKGKGNYSNEENCGWIVEVTNATRIDFNLEQSEFEDCDYCEFVAVTVTSLDMAYQIQGATLKLKPGSPTASVTGSRAMVIFITDINDVESGFRLRYGSGIPLEENVCGGVLNPMLDDFGVISYKANENYVNNEYCQWTIEAPEWGRIYFNLEQSGFTMYNDFVTISSVTSNGTEIGRPVDLDYRNRNASLAGPTALVRFTTDGAGTGTGFRLRYEKIPALVI